MMIDEIKKIKNDWSQVDPIFRTCNLDREVESPHKRRTWKNKNVKS
jgi:hypothetical protein